MSTDVAMIEDGAVAASSSSKKDLSSGYKKTSVGMIPDEWSVSTVGEEFEIQLGKMLDAEKNVGISKPYLGNKSVQWGRIDVEDLPQMRMSRSDLEQFRLRRGDLLVCEGGEVGRAAIWEVPLEECYYQKALHRLRPRKGFDPRLMLALLRYWSEHDLLVNYVSQTSIAHLTREKFSDVPLPVPPFPEQQAIAAALSDADALIASLDKLIAKKRDMKAAAMQQLLTGEERLPGFHGKWRTERLDRVSVLHKEQIVPKNFPEKVFDHYSLPAFDEGRMSVKEYGSSIGSNKFVVPVGALLVAKLNPRIPRVWIPDTISEDSVASTEFLVLRPLEAIERQFMGAVCNAPNFIAEMEAAATGTTGSHQRVHPQVAMAIQIRFPTDIVEQRAIAAVLSDMDTEIAALEARRDKMRAIKQGMMQELLTGRIRLV